MNFAYEERKAAQAAAYLVQLNGGQADVVSLIKWLYLSDREALIRRGFPITGDRMVSMPHGPVLSRIYDQIKLGEDQGLAWYEYLTERQQNVVSLRQAHFQTDELSEFERGVLGHVYETHRHLTNWQLRRLTHELPEYRDPEGSSLPIEPETILQESGWSEEKISDTAMSAREEHFFTLLASGKL